MKDKIPAAMPATVDQKKGASTIPRGVHAAALWILTSGGRRHKQYKCRQALDLGESPNSEYWPKTDETRRIGVSGTGMPRGSTNLHA